MHFIIFKTYEIELFVWKCRHCLAENIVLFNNILIEHYNLLFIKFTLVYLFSSTEN